ncbi:hypothetical protein [Burkholderia guangdongensis]|nr:hypothetical protein [Burkholderia guangdongensis]
MTQGSATALAAGDFVPILRAYLLKAALLEGGYRIPPIQLIQNTL